MTTQNSAQLRAENSAQLGATPEELVERLIAAIGWNEVAGRRDSADAAKEFKEAKAALLDEIKRLRHEAWLYKASAPDRADVY